MTKPTGPVTVGVIDADVAPALRLAGEEARRRGTSVTLLYAVHQVMPAPPESLLLDYQNLEQAASTVLANAAALFRDMVPEVPVETVVERTRPVAALVAASERSSLVVLQRRSRSRLGRIFTGSTMLGVVTHAHCPVVSVPDGWSAQTKRVAVGADETGGPAYVLAQAFEEAALHGAGLTVLHAWRLDRPYADLVSTAGAPSGWEERARKHVEEALEPFRVRYQSVAVDVQIRHQWSAEALLELTEASGLLVLGRHSSHRHLVVLGSLARTLVLEAGCPVQIVPPPRIEPVESDGPAQR